MFRGARVAVVVPAHNEAAHISATLMALPVWVDQVVVVDDASADDTARLARATRPDAWLIRFEQNRGVGAAIAAGYRAAFSGGADIAVVMGGDGQMDPADLPKLLAPVASGVADYSKGDRLSYPGAFGRMPLSRWLGNHVLSFGTSVAVGRTVRDSQCGYTALARDAAARLPLDRLWPRYGYPNDLLGHCVTQGIRTVEVEVRPIYGSERSGVTLQDACLVIPGLLLRVYLRRCLTTTTPRSPRVATT